MQRCIVLRNLLPEMMLFMLLLFVGAALAEDETQSLISNLIHLLMKDNYCTNFIIEDSMESFSMQEAMINLPTMVLHEDFLWKSINNPCDGYIWQTKSLNKIKQYLTQKQNFDAFYFKTNKIFMIFVDDAEHLPVLETLSSTRGYKIILAQQLEESWNVTFLQMKQSTVLKDVDNVRSFVEMALSEWKPAFLAGKKFVISVFNWPPFLYYNGTYAYDGVEYLMITTIGKDWPIQFQMQKDEVGLWTANIQDVVNSKSEVALCGQWQLGRSPGNIETTFPFTDMCATFLVPKPYLVTQISFVFQPLHPYLWILCLTISIAVATLLYFFSKVYYSIGKQKQGTTFHSFSYSLIESIRVFSLGSEPHFPGPKQSVFRFILAAWFATSLMISCGYSSGFTSTLTYPRYTKPINNIKDMIDQNIWWGSHETDTLDVYKTSYIPDLQNLVKRFKKEKSTKEKLYRIRSKNYAVTVNALPNKFLTDTDELDEFALDNMKILPSCAGQYQVIWGVQKNSPFLRIFDKYIFKFIEYGHIAHWFSELRRRYNLQYMEQYYRSNYANSLNENVALDIKKFAAVFALLFVGLFIGFVIFLIEIYKPKALNI